MHSKPLELLVMIGSSKMRMATCIATGENHEARQLSDKLRLLLEVEAYNAGLNGEYVDIDVVARYYPEYAEMWRASYEDAVMIRETEKLIQDPIYRVMESTFRGNRQLLSRILA